MEINRLRIPAWIIVALFSLVLLLFVFLVLSGKQISWNPLAVIDPALELKLAEAENESKRLTVELQQAQSASAARPIHIQKFRIDWDNRGKCDINVDGALCKFPWRVPFTQIETAYLGRTVDCGAGHATTIKTLHVVSDVEVQVYVARPGGRIDIAPDRFCWGFEVVAVGKVAT